MTTWERHLCNHCISWKHFGRSWSLEEILNFWVWLWVRHLLVDVNKLMSWWMSWKESAHVLHVLTIFPSAKKMGRDAQQKFAFFDSFLIIWRLLLFKNIFWVIFFKHFNWTPYLFKCIFDCNLWNCWKFFIMQEPERRQLLFVSTSSTCQVHGYLYSSKYSCLLFLHISL